MDQARGRCEAVESFLRRQIDELQLKLKQDADEQAQHAMDWYLHQIRLYKQHVENDSVKRLDALRDAAAVTIGDELARAQGERDKEMKKVIDDLKSKSLRQSTIQEMRTSLRLHALATGNTKPETRNPKPSAEARARNRQH